MQNKIRQYLEAVFSLDTRSLALFRVGLASIILVGLVSRSFDISAHYTDVGVLPRSTLWSWVHWYLSIHMLSGSLWLQIFLLLAAGFFAIMLLIGYKTRLAAAMTWFLLFSIHLRNPFVLNAGDIFLRLLLLWAIFLPLGAAYSLDSILRPPKRGYKVFSVGSVALVLQIVSLYLFTAFFKTGPEWHREGTAAYYALQYEQITRPFGLFLLRFPKLLTICTRLVFWLEQYGPLLFLSPFATSKVRMLAVGLFVAFHFVLAMLFHLGGFPWIVIVGLVALIPGWFWDRVSAWQRDPTRIRERLYYDADCRFCRFGISSLQTLFFLPPNMFEPAQQHPTIYAGMMAGHSWVFSDVDGAQYTKFAAFSRLCALSPVAWPLVYVFRLPVVTRIGNALYGLFAGHRPFFSGLVFRLRPFDSDRELGAFWQGAVVFFVVYGLMWNLGGFYKMREDTLWFGYSTGLSQRWDMFSPAPTKHDGWYVMPASLRDGTIVDLWRDGRPVDWAKPYMPEIYRSQHWQKYLESFWMPERSYLYPHFASYLCRTWNERHSGGKEAVSVELVFMHERAMPDYQPGPITKMSLYMHTCI